MKEYRETIPFLVGEQDRVLELGCEWGTTTALLASRCKSIIGTDISPKCIERVRRLHSGIRFETLDAFDIRAALQLGEQFTKIYMDLSGISGYRSLLDAISLVNMYARVFRPEAIVIKSGALKQFTSRCILLSEMQ